MKLKAIFYFVSLILSSNLYSQSDSIKRYELQNDMPIFYQQMKNRLTYPFSFNNSDYSFSKWKKRARNILFDCIKPALLKSSSYDMMVLESENRNGYKVEKIEFNLSQYSRVPAYLLVPNGEGPFPAVLLLHDHGAKFIIGKEKMVRPFHVDSIILSEADAWADKCYDGQYVGDYLASNGYVVLVLDALFWGERGRKEGVRYDSQQALAANMLQMGMSWGSFIVWDDINSAEFLSSLPIVNKSKIGTMGFSMGAHRAWMLSAATDIVKASAAVCWMNTTDSLMTLSNNQNKGGSAYSMIIPNIRNFMDYPHVASIAAPKPALFINGKRDKLFPVQGSIDAFNEMHKVWKASGKEDNLVTMMNDIPHFCSKDVQKTILNFFDNNLK